jgi:anti-anti-sigma factor
MSESCIELGEALDITTVASFRDECLKALAEIEIGVHLNAKNLKNIDTSGFQLLVALKKSSEAQKKTFVIHGVNKEVQKKAETLGLAGYLWSDSIQA